ncbi:unnamed protein product [Symbiodinium sp. CCMP2592]|nr:unnamed protein product [Symbiodinium sp. CCMP2592]
MHLSQAPSPPDLGLGDPVKSQFARRHDERPRGPGWWTADTSSDEDHEEAPYVAPVAAVALRPSSPDNDIKPPVSAIPSLSEQRWSGVHSALHDLESMIAQISDGASVPKHLFGHRSGNLTSFTGGADFAAGGASKAAEASRLAKAKPPGSLQGGPAVESSRTAGASRVNAAQVVHQDPAALSAGRPSTPSGRGGSCAVLGEHVQSDPSASHDHAPPSPRKADASAQTDLSGPGPGPVPKGGEDAQKVGAGPGAEAQRAEMPETEGPSLGLGPPLCPANAMEVTEASTAPTHPDPDVSKSVADLGNTSLTIPDKEAPSSDINRSPSLSPIPHQGGLDMTVDDSRPFSLENSSRSGSEDEGPAAQPQPASAPSLPAAPAPAPLAGRGSPAAKESLPIDSSSDSNSESLGHLELIGGKRGGPAAVASASKSKAMTDSESESSDGHLELAKSKPGASKSAAAQIADDLGVLGALRSSSSSSGSSRVEVAKAKPGSDGIMEVESADDSSDGF